MRTGSMLNDIKHASMHALITHMNICFDYTYICMHACFGYTHEHTHAHTHTHTHTHTHIYIYTYTQSCMHAHLNIYMYERKCIYSSTCTNIHTHKHA